MSVQVVDQQALGPAAKGQFTGSGRENSLPGILPQQAAEPDTGSVKRALPERMKEVYAKPTATTELQFLPDLQHRRVFIKVSDAETGEVLFEIPSEKVARALDQLIQIASSPTIDFEA